MRRFFVPSSKYFYVFLSIVALSAYAFFVQAVQLPDGTAPSSGGYAVDEFILDPGCSPNDLVFDCYKNIAEPAWLLGGNAGTDGGTADFIGTTDAQDVVIKTNGDEAARFSALLGSVAFGHAIPADVIFPGSFALNAPDASGLGSYAIGAGSVASGIGSFAFGSGGVDTGSTNTASGNSSFTLGFSNTVTAVNNFAFGEGNTVGGTNGDSYAFGEGNTVSSADGDAYAFGIANNVSGESSFAFGRDNTVSGDHAFVFGENGSAEGDGSYAFAGGTAYSDLEIAFGAGTSYAPLGTNDDRAYNFALTGSDLFTILKNGNAAIGVNNFEADADTGAVKLKVAGSLFVGQGNLAWTSGEETKMFLNTTARAFRMGSVDNTTWEGANVGARSIAMGFANVGSNLRAPRASGAYSMAFGSGSIASASNSIAIGYEANAAGQYGVAIGYDAVAGSSAVAIGSNVTAGTNSTAFGNGTIASGPNSTAFGVNTNATWASTAFGSNTTASGFYSTAFGDNALATGSYSTAFGTFTRAESCSGCTAFGSGTFASTGASTAFGSSTTASGDGATAFGSGTQATSSSATAFGNNTDASGGGATAFGDNTTASGSFATAFGSLGVAEGDFATVFGVAGTAPSYAETVIGFYPTMYTANNATVADAGDRLFTIGNGVDETDRHDTFTVLKSGLVGVGYDYFETTANTELLQVNGLIRSTGSLVTSDSRLKNTVNSISYGLATINQLRPVSYNLNSDGSHQLGFIAQEVQPVLPELVANGNYLALNYIGFIPVLTKAIQELDVKISNINAQAATLFTNQGFLDGMIAWFANSTNGIQKLFTHEVHTDTLCVGNTCVTETELQQLLQQNNVSVPPPATPPVPEPDPVPDIVPTPDEEVAPDPAPEPNPEVVPDPVPEPAPEPVI